MTNETRSAFRVITKETARTPRRAWRAGVIFARDLAHAWEIALGHAAHPGDRHHVVTVESVDDHEPSREDDPKSDGGRLRRDALVDMTEAPAGAVEAAEAAWYADEGRRV
jgi:hypothetical protein